jgi:hypothetical protein
MLASHLAKKIIEAFPTLSYERSEDGRVIIITGPCAEVGNIEIQDDEYELTVFVGNFTHWHVGCYEEGYSELEKAEYIASRVVEFLSDLFSDKIVMWGSHSGGGGFYNREEAPQKSKSGWFGFGGKDGERSEWVWSGRIGG